MTLQTKDLMIGDWVRVPDLYKYVRVNAVYPTMICPNPHDDDVHPVIGDEYLQPIPLTLEILNTNFSSCPGWWFIGDSSVYFRIYKKEGKYLLCIRSKKVQELRMTITYLHELQHALKLCGIEKTIEL